MSLDTIFAESKKITIGNKEIEIKQVSVGDLPFAVKVLSKVYDGDKKTPVMTKVTKLVVDDFPLVTQLIQTLTSLTTEDIQKLNLAAAAHIVVAIAKENVDFLSSHLPSLQANLAEAMAGLNKSKN